MTDAQAWTLIIGSLSIAFGLVGVVTGQFSRVLRAELGSVRTELRTELGAVRTEIGSVRAEMRTEIAGLRAEMLAGFTRVDERIDHLDRDVQALMRHLFRQE